MTDEAEVAAVVPEQTSAPEPKTEEAAKPAIAEAEQDESGNKAELADDKDADPASADTDEEDGDADKPKKRTRTSQLRQTIREKSTQIEELTRRLAEREAGQKRPPPKEEEFDGNYEAFNRALTAHETAELLRDERLQDEKRSIEDRQREVRRERLIDHQERVDDLRKVIPNYDTVIESGLKNINGNPENIELLLQSEKSELITYYLAEKPERAREFAAMTPLEANKHIGKLEARLSLPSPKKQTQAPAPVSAVKGGAASTPDPTNMDMASYVAWRNAKAS